MSYIEAVKFAHKRATQTGEAYFVVRESGEYHISNEIDLDTFYAGLSDRDILYCTSDRE
jgi:hypothetical protein